MIGFGAQIKKIMMFTRKETEATNLAKEDPYLYGLLDNAGLISDEDDKKHNKKRVSYGRKKK